MAEANREIKLNAENSIREFWPGTYGGFMGDGIGIWYGSMGSLLPAWGTLACDRMLREIDYAQHNALWSGAKNIWKQKFLSTPYEISGGRNTTYQWQDIFFEADFGEGYDYMMSKALDDYLTTNRGLFLEKVSYGDPDTPLADGARVLGLNHLDAMRIVFTGNREYPYVYYSEVTNKPHRLHYTRVVHLAFNPSPDTRLYGIGKSPLYDAMTTVNAQILLGRHQNELLSDLPPPGLVLFENIRGEDVGKAMQMFEAQRRMDGESVYRAPLQLEGKDPEKPAKMSFMPLAQVPEGFDYEKYMQTHVNLLALNLQLDPQDIWPLTGQPLGSGTQSKVLQSKTQNKGPGYMLTLMTRQWNNVLPRQLEWKYKAPNAEQDLQTAQIAQSWMTITKDGKQAGILTEDEARQMLANQVPAYADVLLDESGELIRLPDADPKEAGQEVIAQDMNQQMMSEQVQPGTMPPTDGQAQELPENSPINQDETTGDDAVQLTKEYADTKSAFESDLTAIFQDAADGGVSKASFSARLRNSIKTYGKNAYIDGLESGGVDAAEFDETDSSNYADILASQSQYVSGLADTIYTNDNTVAGGAEFKAGLWGNKTLNDFYYKGVESADKNGMYTFTGIDGKESCDTCVDLKGQTHRMKWYVDKRLRPGVDTDNFDCGGWRCQHYLEKQ